MRARLLDAKATNYLLKIIIDMHDILCKFFDGNQNILFQVQRLNLK